MLTRAFASASSPSLFNSNSVGHGNLANSLSSTQLLSESNDEELQYDAQDDSLHGPNIEIEHRHGSDDLYDVFGAAGEIEGLPTTAANCDLQTAVAVSGVSDLHSDLARPIYPSPFASAAIPADRSRRPPCPASNTVDNSSSIAIPLRQSSNPFPQMARSCPRPIAMPRKARHSSVPQDQDELPVFIPPHELAATSLVDPPYVAESMSRKGSAALRMRSAALRKTGFYEGHTETLRVSNSFKP